MTSLAPSRGRAWERVREVEELMAFLACVDERRGVVRVHAWREGDWGAVFEEVSAMRGELEELRAGLSQLWGELMDEARGRGDA